MMFVGPLAFLMFFLFMSDGARAKMENFTGGVMDWVAGNRPGSYLILAAFAACALLSCLLVVRWPQREEPDNPLLQYRRDHPDMDP